MELARRRGADGAAARSVDAALLGWIARGRAERGTGGTAGRPQPARVDIGAMLTGCPGGEAIADGPGAAPPDRRYLLALGTALAARRRATGATAALTRAAAAGPAFRAGELIAEAVAATRELVGVLVAVGRYPEADRLRAIARSLAGAGDAPAPSPVSPQPA